MFNTQDCFLISSAPIPTRKLIFYNIYKTNLYFKGNKTESMHNLAEAKSHFKDLYAEKSGNMWEHRNNFVKVPGKMYPIDVDYGEDEEVQKMDIVESESKLHSSVQSLIKMIFDVNTMKKLMLEFELDTEKMPLGMERVCL